MAADNKVEAMPWVGISRSAQAHVREVYTDFVGAYMQMTNGDYIIIFAGADGAIVNMQQIVTSTAGGFGGWDPTLYRKQWENNFVL